MVDEAKAPQPMFPVDLESAPKITLAGREWAIPPLAIKQASKVVPALMEIIPLVGMVIGATSTVDGVTTTDEKKMMSAMHSIDEDAFSTITKAVFWALKRGYPQLGQGEFDEMPVSLPELLNALPVIMRQTGFIKPKPAGETPAGEAPAVAQ